MIWGLTYFVVKTAGFRHLLQVFLLYRKPPWTDFTGQTRIRFCNLNRIVIDPDQVFDRDHDRDYHFKIGIRFESINR